MPGRKLTSVELVGGRTSSWPKTIQRKDVPVGHVFSVKGNSTRYLDTGKRTMPPSGAKVEIVINGSRTKVDVYKPLEIDCNGDYVIGYQSLIVSGTIKRGSDGAVLGVNPSTTVRCYGPAEIVLPD